LKKQRTYSIDFILLLVLLCAAFIWSLVSGSVNISIKNIFSILSGEETKNIYAQIFYNIRLPKAITAVLAGISLSVCGLMMQTLFRNPLAGPYILGINSGASLFVAFLITGASALGIERSSLLFSGGLAFFATAGAVVTLMIILAISFRIKNHITLLLTGIMLGYIYGALQSLLEYFSNPGDLKTFVLWGMGSIQNTGWQELKIFAPVCLVGFFLSLLLIKPLNLFLLGDNYAQSSGLNIQKTKWMIILLTGILSGLATAFCGPIAFIGLAVPHLARIIFKSNNHALILPASAILGAVTLLICDVIGNFGPANTFIPLNVTTSLLGAPIVIWLLFTNKKMNAG
jgi:iron complex transport system permease protein